MKQNELITAEFFPSIPREEIAPNIKYRYSLSDLSGLGNGFAVVGAAIAEAIQSAPSTDGLYRCVFPEGVAGHLAEFKDGSGYMGTILNQNGIAGQARWVPVDGASTAMSINPVTLAVAVAMLNIDKSLSDIQEMQDEILSFLHDDKASKLEGSFNSLASILDQYRFNNDNDVWKNGKFTEVASIKTRAEGNIIFYRKRITKELSKQRAIHSYRDADKMKSELEKNFKYYQLSVYTLAYASFLEVILAENYSEDYLSHLADRIRDNSFQYRKDYSSCYELLESYMKGSLQAVTSRGIGKAGITVGKALEKVPILSKGPVDEAMIAAGQTINKLGSTHGKSAMRDFSNNQDAGIQLFVKNIETINELSNHPVEVFFDKDEVCICVA